jgi:hypothetical protein
MSKDDGASPGRWASIRARTPWEWILPALLLAAVIGVVVVAVVVLTTPSTLVAATLRTERVQFRVTSAESARMAFSFARTSPDDACREKVLVQPGRGALVTYTRPARSALEVYIEGPVIVQVGNGTQTAQTNLTVTVSGSGDCAADAEAGQRLPIVGSAASFGGHPVPLRDAGDVPLRLLSGQLTVYGRAVSDLGPFSIAVSGRRHALYVAGEIAVPGGTVIEEPRTATGELIDSGQSAIWTGFADVDLGKEGSTGMTVEAATNAGSVALFLPAPKVAGDPTRSGEPETVSLSHMARLAGDPHLLMLYGVLGVLAAVLGALAGAVNFLRRFARPKKAAE